MIDHTGVSISDPALSRRFYEAALKQGKTLFTRPMGTITYLQPGLTLLDITHLK